MSFDLMNWNTISSGGRRGDLGGGTLFSYTTSDSPLTVHQDSYFDVVKGRLSPGDIISTRYKDPSDNLTEMIVVGQSSPIVKINQILSSSMHKDGFSLLMTDASILNVRTKVQNSLFRQILTIYVIINKGTVTTNNLQLFFFINGFSQITIPFPMTFTVGQTVGASIAAPIDGTLITLPGVNTFEIATDGTTTTSTPVEVGCFIETLNIPNK